MILKVYFKGLKYVILMDYFINNIIKKHIFKPHYKLAGKCNNCGTCCKGIAVMIADYIANNKILRNLVITFYSRVNGFTFTKYEEDTNLLIFDCNNFDESTKKCKNYLFRPALCRQYPRPIKFFAKPYLHDTCGFYIDK